VRCSLDAIESNRIDAENNDNEWTTNPKKNAIERVDNARLGSLARARPNKRTHTHTQTQRPHANCNATRAALRCLSVSQSVEMLT